MIKKIKKCWGNFLIDTFGVPPSVIWESCYLEFKEELDNMVMTENKRFELRFTGGDTFIIDNENHINHFIGFEDVTDDFKCIVGLLNELHEENQALKSDRARYEEECILDVFRELYEENKELKKQVDYWKQEYDDLYRSEYE